MDGQRFRYGFPGFYGCRPFGELVVTFIEYRIFRVVFGVVGGRERRVDAKCHLDILFCRGDQHGGEFAVELRNGLLKVTLLSLDVSATSMYAALSNG